MKAVSTTNTTGKTLYAFPDNVSLSLWNASRVRLFEQTAPNTGRYTAVLDESISSLWRLFEGESQPASWSYAIELFDLGEGAIGGGAHSVFAAITSSGSPVSNAQVTIKSGTTIVATALTNAAGAAAFALNAGSYTISVVASGFTSIADSAFTVSGNSTVNRSLTLAPYDPPSTPSTCRVRIHATRGAIGVQARVQITTSKSGREADRAFLQTAFDGLTDNTGLLFVDLAWSSVSGVGSYRFRLLDVISGAVLHDRTCTVPDETNADYEDLV